MTARTGTVAIVTAGGCNIGGFLNIEDGFVAIDIVRNAETVATIGWVDGEAPGPQADVKRSPEIKTILI
jgi:hypothetical protein